ncbi:TIGR02300 family protein [Sneathiella limimaris]|uniref:TIGR02300 family protein n=1 Tax=Sneathiella limimaris TaxID=1964213 RepID=UPI00146B2F37|nr:TIGR02300 family protein [Sneathiella limimaris]
MAKPEWGSKHRCKSCGKPFYDMLKNPIVCPACGTELVVEKLLKPSKAAKVDETEVKAKAEKAKKVVSEDEEDVSLLLDDEEILAEDDVDLEDDDNDDLGVVVRSSDEDDT